MNSNLASKNKPALSLESSNSALNPQAKGKYRIQGVPRELTKTMLLSHGLESNP